MGIVDEYSLKFSDPRINGILVFLTEVDFTSDQNLKYFWNVENSGHPSKAPTTVHDVVQYTGALLLHYFFLLFSAQPRAL